MTTRDLGSGSIEPKAWCLPRRTAAVQGATAIRSRRGLCAAQLKRRNESFPDSFGRRMQWSAISVLQ
jgi:hypothetical protein